VKFKTIWADPPWRYRKKRTGGTWKSGAGQKYRTMTVRQIKALPVDQIAARDAHLILWTTVPLLKSAYEVMEAWGFEDKTIFFWVKLDPDLSGRLGLGHWFRGVVEPCIIGSRGEARAFHLQVPNILFMRPEGHSRKPAAFWDLIEPVTTGPKIELFSREPRNGWTCLGKEIDGRDIRRSLREIIECPA